MRTWHFFIWRLPQSLRNDLTLVQYLVGVLVALSMSKANFARVYIKNDIVLSQDGPTHHDRRRLLAFGRDAVHCLL